MKVYCSECHEQKNVEKVKTIDIEEDMQGVDVLTFECLDCHTVQKSRIYGTHYYPGHSVGWRQGHKKIN